MRAVSTISDPRAGSDRVAMEDSPLRAGDDIGAAGTRSISPSIRSKAEASSRAAETAAMSMIAVGERGSLLGVCRHDMRKLRLDHVRGVDRLPQSMGENVQAIADAFGRRPNDITTIVLDRPRHHDLIEEIRAAGRASS